MTSPHYRRPASRCYDERDEDGRAHWRLDGQVLKGSRPGFTLAELCALYLSRNMLEAVAGTPFQRDLTLAFTRLEKMLSPRMRQFLDRLPHVLAAKPGPRARGGAASPDLVARLLEATLHYRVAHMKYNSVSSGRMKDYVIHPYRLAFAQGGLYLLAYVPDYKDDAHLRHRSHCARCRSTSRRSRRHARFQTMCSATRSASTQDLRRMSKIAFDKRVAPCVRARVWHPSPGASRRRGRRRRADARRLQRHRAAQLDPRLGAIRAGRRAGGARRRISAPT